MIPVTEAATFLSQSGMAEPIVYECLWPYLGNYHKQHTFRLFKWMSTGMASTVPACSLVGPDVEAASVPGRTHEIWSMQNTVWMTIMQLIRGGHFTSFSAMYSMHSWSILLQFLLSFDQPYSIRDNYRWHHLWIQLLLTNSLLLTCDNVTVEYSPIFSCVSSPNFFCVSIVEVSTLLPFLYEHIVLQL